MCRLDTEEEAPGKPDPGAAPEILEATPSTCQAEAKKGCDGWDRGCWQADDSEELQLQDVIEVECTKTDASIASVLKFWCHGVSFHDVTQPGRSQGCMTPQPQRDRCCNPNPCCPSTSIGHSLECWIYERGFRKLPRFISEGLFFGALFFAPFFWGGRPSALGKERKKRGDAYVERAGPQAPKGVLGCNTLN